MNSNSSRLFPIEPLPFTLTSDPGGACSWLQDQQLSLPPAPPAAGLPAPVVLPAVGFVLPANIVSAQAKGATQVTSSILSTDTISFQMDTATAASQSQQKTETVAAMEDGEYMFVTSSCTGLSLSNGGEATAESGSVVRNDKNDGFELAEGKLVVAAAKNTVKLNTAQGQVEVPSSGIAVVEQTKSKVVRISNLSESAAQLTMIHSGKRYSIEVGRGEGLAIAGQDVNDEELIPVDGIDRTPIDANIKIASKKIVKHKFDVEAMARISLLSKCNVSDLLSNNRKNSLQKSSLPTPKLKSSIEGLPGTQDNLKSVAYATPAQAPSPPPATRSLDVLASSDLMVRKSGSVKCTLERENVLKLQQGEVFVHAKRAGVVRTPNGTVFVQPGCNALVSVTNGVMSVRALHSLSDGIAVAMEGTKRIPLAVGQELVATASSSEPITSILEDDNVARRRCRYYDRKPTRFALSEYSLVSLISESPTLQHMLVGERRDPLSSKILKSAVAFSMATASHGPFKVIGE